MKYFLDTEFIEGFHKPRWGKSRHFIDLISIGIVCEDGRTYYSISSEYKYYQANEWVRENVIKPAYTDFVHGDLRNSLSVVNFQKYVGKLNRQIVNEILLFFGCFQTQNKWVVPSGIEIYGYYADYDWVLFCSLFGRMINLPKGFPMYCRGLKQMLDECYTYQENKYEGETRLESWLKFVKNHKDYPKEENEHNALADAKWNFELYKFITQRKFLNSKQKLERSVATEDHSSNEADKQK